MDDSAVPAFIASVPPAELVLREDDVLPGRFQVGSDYRTVRRDGLPNWLLMLTVAGRGLVRPATGDPLCLPPGRVLAFEPATPQDYGTDPDAGAWDLAWVHLIPGSHWRPHLQWPVVAPGVRILDLSAPVATAVVTALDEATAHHHSRLPRSSALARNAVERALLYCSSELADDRLSNPHIVALSRLVSTHLDRDHTVGSLAREVGLSPSHLAHLVRDQLETTVMGYLEELRLRAAAELLEVTGLTVTQVAERVGYRDPLYFSRRFRRRFGIPPSRRRYAAR